MASRPEETPPLEQVYGELREGIENAQRLVEQAREQFAGGSDEADSQ